jgi:hypothetical protein
MSGRATATEGVAIDLPVNIARGEVLHFLGYPEGLRPADRVERLMDDAILEARVLVAPRGLFARFSVERSSELDLEPIEASGLVVGLVTIGPSLDRRVDELVSSGEPTRALLIDAAGSAAVEEAADRLGAIIGDDGAVAASASPVAHVSCRVSPGYGSWSILAQQSLFEALPHQRIGVSLLPTLLMTPRKSISFAMWLGADRRPLAGLAGCARCGLAECRYRRVKGEE